MPAAFAKLWSKRAAGAGYAALVAALLGGFRSGEVRRLAWSDIEGDVITIPAERMKARELHRAPLTPLLAAHLTEQPRWWNTELVLPGNGGRPLSAMTLAVAMRRIGWTASRCMVGAAPSGTGQAARDGRGSPLHPIDAQSNRIVAKVRARVERPFRVIKRRFGYVKSRFRGLAKNRAQTFTLFALENPFLVRRKLMS